MDPIETVILDPDYRTVRAEANKFAADLAACIDGDGIELPSLPEIALKIRDALARDDVDLDRLAELAGSDPALAARIMRIANSALFVRSGQPPATLHAAVVRIGSRAVRNTAVALAAQQVFIGYSSSEIHPEIRRVWRHSLHVATICHLLLAIRRTNIAPDEGFLAGLLHEVGALFILWQSKGRSELWAEPEALNRVIADWHGRVGAKILEHWGFADNLQRMAHDHDQCSLACGSPISLTEIVAVANYLSGLCDETDDLDSLVAGLPSFGALQLDYDAAFFVLDTAQAETATLISGLDGKTETQPAIASRA